MPTGPGTPLATLYRCTSRRTRGIAGGAAVASFVAKSAIVLTAFGVAIADARLATILGVVAAVAFAAQRVLAGAARVGAECDLYLAASRAMLEGDVLSVPRVSPLQTLFESGYQARQLLADTLPDLAADALATLVVLPLLARELPPRLLAVSACAALVVVGCALAVRRLSASWQERVVAAQHAVRERAALAVDGRLELVAGAREAVALGELERAALRYRGVMGRASIVSAFLGRAPVVAGIATVAVIALVDGASREAVTSALLGKALLLASALPIVLGAILGASELVRAMPAVRPLAELLAAPRRPELARAGRAAAEVPARIAADGLAFGYEANAPRTLDGVSFEWLPGRALVLEGRNGAGKSTLLRLLLGLRDPSRGAITVGDRPLAEVDLARLRRDVAYLPQRPYLGEPHLTVRDAVVMLEPGATDASIERALERVALVEALRGRAGSPLDVRIGALSAGQRQRLALARVLLRDAPVVLLDEPDANLDRAGIQLVAELVAELASSGKMVAIAAHTAELGALAGARVSLG